MNKKNERIRKLMAKGITDPEKIAKKLGLHGPEGIERVKEGIEFIQQRIVD